jgi:hypothetical protein
VTPKWRARKPAWRRVRTMDDHLALMQDAESWFAELQWIARNEIRALGRLDDAVKQAVKETGYPAADALLLQRRVGPEEAVKLIWKEYRAEIKRAYA